MHTKTNLPSWQSIGMVLILFALLVAWFFFIQKARSQSEPLYILFQINIVTDSDQQVFLVTTPLEDAQDAADNISTFCRQNGCSIVEAVEFFTGSGWQVASSFQSGIGRTTFILEKESP